jgi:serine phosphatase RsbU (regulator of sigma subunit)
MRIVYGALGEQTRASMLPFLGGLAGMTRGGVFLETLLDEARLTAPNDLPALLARHATTLGVADATVYLVDLGQTVLIPFVEAEGPGVGRQQSQLAIDTTMAGRAFQHLELLTQESTASSTQVWVPLVDGSERLGVLGVSIGGSGDLDADDGILRTDLGRFAALAAQLIMTKTLYGDTVVRLRRRAEMGLAAEIQWGLLPPLGFATDRVSIAAILEPAYEVAGDSVDYAVDDRWARFAVFDGMGHGLKSAQLASVTVAAYRNARRNGQSLVEVAGSVDAAVAVAFNGEAFTTAVLAELATDTGRLTWISAGHPEPLLFRNGRMIKSLHVTPRLPLGLGSLGDSNREVNLGVQQLQPGDTVLLYTDGVTEGRAPDGEFYGLDRLIEILGRTMTAGLPTSETLRRLVAGLLEHQQGQLRDDATLLLANWPGDSSNSPL